MGGVAGTEPISTSVHRSPNKLKRSYSIFSLLYRDAEKDEEKKRFFKNINL
jgi:hypothetical protein